METTNTLPALLEPTILDEIKAQVLERLPAVKSWDDYKLAAEYRKSSKDWMKRLEEKRKEITRPIDEQKRAVMDFFEPLLAALKEHDEHHKRLILGWDAEQERIRREQQAELERQARAAAQKEAEKRALEAIEQGNEIKAEAILDAAETVPVAVAQLAPAKPIPGSGVHYRENWRAEIEDPVKFMSWVIESKRIEYVSPNLKYLDSTAKASKRAELAPPGVKFVCEKIPVITGGRRDSSGF